MRGDALLVIALCVSCSRTALPLAPPGITCDDAGCHVCTPRARECQGRDVYACADDGLSWQLVERCDETSACLDARCVPLCEVARAQPSSAGCELWSVDLDQFEPTSTGDDARLPYGVVIANTWTVPARVVIERDDAPPGAPPQITTLLTRVVPARDIESIELPTRPVDAADMGPAHTALTSRAYRITSSIPVVVVQSNPLRSAGWSQDSSLLLPTEMLGTRTTVVGWPQTLAQGSPDLPSGNAAAYLTIVGTHDGTHVHVHAGPMGPAPSAFEAGGGIPRIGPHETFDATLDAFDVLDLQTATLGADPTGTIVESDAPVAIFVGSQGSDVPSFDQPSDRLCCADHLEEQLWPDRFAGTYFVVGRQSSRRAALARSLGHAGQPAPEPEWVHVVAVDDVDLHVPSGVSLPAHLAAGESAIARVEASFDLVLSRGRAHVMTALPSQDVLGVPTDLPGGDPSLVLVPPVESFTRSANVVVPESSPFDFVTILAEPQTHVAIDGTELGLLNGPDGAAACRSETTARFVVHQCEVSFPTLVEGAATTIEDGTQNDGLHLIDADRPIAVTVSGWSNYISYGHPGAISAF